MQALVFRVKSSFFCIFMRIVFGAPANYVLKNENTH